MDNSTGYMGFTIYMARIQDVGFTKLVTRTYPLVFIGMMARISGPDFTWRMAPIPLANSAAV